MAVTPSPIRADQRQPRPGLDPVGNGGCRAAPLAACRIVRHRHTADQSRAHAGICCHLTHGSRLKPGTSRKARTRGSTEAKTPTPIAKPIQAETGALDSPLQKVTVMKQA